MGKLSDIVKSLIYIIFLASFFFLKSTASPFYNLNNAIIDNSDNLILLEGKGTFKSLGVSEIYIPVPGEVSPAPAVVNTINKITAMTLSNPKRYVIDIPNSILRGSSRIYKIQNSSKIKSLSLSQFSTNPHIVRAVIIAQDDFDLANFKTYTNGTNIVIAYNSPIVSNSIQRKFYTPAGDGDKTQVNQNTSSILTYNATNETVEFIPKFDTKYFLTKISQNSDGLILRGLGEIAHQRVTYNTDNTEAVFILDNAKINTNLENKTYVIPSSNKENKATLTINTLNSKKVKLTLRGNSLKDYRFVIAPDGQSMFISHRSYIINTQFSSDTPKVNNYKIEKTSTGYDIFSIDFSQSIAYDVFELNDCFYLDINNLSDYNTQLFSQMLTNTDIPIKVLKISTDKTRYVIPMKTDKYTLNLSYANIESNSKSIKVCFKRNAPALKKDDIKVVSKTEPEKIVIEDENIKYIPKKEDNQKTQTKKKNKDTQISSMKKVVIDPGHGGADSGAARGIYLEKNLNLEVARLVQEKLTKKNIYVYMTRTKDDTLTLEERVNYSNELSPDIYVSIHTNSTVAGDSYGLETHYYKDDSLELARTIHSHFANDKNLEKWETKDRGVIKSRFYVINHTEAPSVLIEIGFISNAAERAKLHTKARQEEIADSITKGILEYLKVK